MRVIRIAEVETVPIDTATPVPGWTGGEVRRTRQPLLPDGASENFSSSVVNFERGATTGWHTHESDQILVVTSGVGTVANETEEAADCRRRRGAHPQGREPLARRAGRVIYVPHHHYSSVIVTQSSSSQSQAFGRPQEYENHPQRTRESRNRRGGRRGRNVGSEP